MSTANEISELKDLTAEPTAKHVTNYRLDEVNLVAFDYADKLFITLSASFGTSSIASYATVVGIPAGVSLTLIFTATTGVVKTLLNITRKKKKKHNKIIALARSKLNIIENLISQALIDFEITHEGFSKIIYEKNNYEHIIDNIKSVKSVDDLNKENN